MIKRLLKDKEISFIYFMKRTTLEFFIVKSTLKPFLPEKGKSPQKIILTENAELVINRYVEQSYYKIK